jgi:poly-gamma-glutamate synthesis protein (capsule biosynthesis protein)
VPETVVILTGDINPARCVYQFAKDANDMALPYRAIAPILQAADIAVGSLDASISDINPPTPCIETTRNLLAPSAVVSGLAYAGFDVITVATNHIKDCGLIRGCVHESMLDSMWHLAEAGIQPVGAGRTLSEAAQPVIVTVNGTRFAFLGFTAINGMTWAEADRPGTLPAQMAIVIPAIEAAKAQADVVIVLPQWGREFRREISFEQWEWAQEMVEAGAMLIVGNNPHRVQGVETFPNGAVVAYALGNFVFDQQWSDGTQYTVQGMMVKATFRGTQLANVELIPIHIYDNFQPRLAPPDEAAAILQDVVTSMATAPRR